MTPKASSTCRSARARSSRSRCSSGRPTTSFASACARRALSTSGPWPVDGAAAAIATRPAARSPALPAIRRSAVVALAARIDAGDALIAVGRMDGVLLIDKPAGPTSHDVVARTAANERRAQHRPHGHARSARHRPAAARARPGDAPRVAPHRAATRPTRRPSARLRHRHRRRRGRADRRAADALPADDADRAGARAVPGDLRAAAAAALRQEGRRRQGLRAGARRDARAAEAGQVTVRSAELARRATETDV